MSRIGAVVVALIALALAGCQSGIGPDQERPRATIHAYETQVRGLERELRDQRATLAALTPPPPTATPTPFSKQWRVVVVGPVALREQVGVRDGLTPVTAAGVFLVVPITVTNLTDTPAAFNPAHSLVVIDAEGDIYDLDVRATGAAYLLDFGYEASFAPRQPGITYRDVLVFDVDPEASGFTLASLDGSYSTKLPTG